MPNHTTTILTIDGPAHEAARFIQENKTDEQAFSFEAQFPTPEESKERENVVRLKECATDNPNKILFPSWYTWRVDNWGTKWDCYDVEDWSDNEIRYFTAWSPASNFFLHVSMQYPDLTFHHAFADEGGGYVGEQTIKEGKVDEEHWPDWDSEAGIALRDTLGVYYPEDENEEDWQGCSHFDGYGG